MNTGELVVLLGRYGWTPAQVEALPAGLAEWLAAILP